MWLIIVALLCIGLTIYCVYRERSHEIRYEDQTGLRRGTIRKLYKEPMTDKDWEHMALVLKFCGCRDRKNEELSVGQVKNEHAEMVLFDLEIEVVIEPKS